MANRSERTLFSDLHLSASVTNIEMDRTIRASAMRDSAAMVSYASRNRIVSIIQHCAI